MLNETTSAETYFIFNFLIIYTKFVMNDPNKKVSETFGIY